MVRYAQVISVFFLFLFVLTAQPAAAQTYTGGTQTQAWTTSLSQVITQVITSYCTHNPPPQGSTAGSITKFGTPSYYWFFTLELEVQGVMQYWVIANPPPAPGT